MSAPTLILDKDEALSKNWPRAFSQLEAEGYRVSPETRCDCGAWICRAIAPGGRVLVFELHPRPETQEPAFSEHQCPGWTRPEEVWPQEDPKPPVWLRARRPWF